MGRPPLHLTLVSSSGACLSGKEKAHKHKQIFPVTAQAGGGSPDRVGGDLPTGWGGGSPDRVGGGSKVYVLCAEPKEHKRFVQVPGREESGARPGGSVTGVTEKLFMCQMFMCLFRPLVLGFLRSFWVDWVESVPCSHDFLLVMDFLSCWHFFTSSHCWCAHSFSFGGWTRWGSCLSPSILQLLRLDSCSHCGHHDWSSRVVQHTCITHWLLK